MKHELSKERLEEIAADGFVAHGEIKAMARAVLAAHEQEPVMEVRSHFNGEYVCRKMTKGTLKPGVMLYTHPAPSIPAAVPEEMTVSDEMTVTAQMFAKGHNACRASILTSGMVHDWVPFDGRSPYDVPCTMPLTLRELIAEEIGILFSEDDAQGIWTVCRRAAMLQSEPVVHDDTRRMDWLVSKR